MVTVGTLVVGAGIVGCSIAHHLAAAGDRSVLVIDRSGVATETTARSAGLVSFSRPEADAIRLIRRTLEAIAELEAEFGDPVDFRRVGTLRVAFSPEWQREVEHLEAALRDAQVPARWIDAAEAAALCPWLDLAGARRRLLVEAAGFVDAPRLAMAYARGARAGGVRFRHGVEVRGLLRRGDRIVGVETSEGPIHAGLVIDAAGAWAPALAASAGMAVGAVPTRSHYWLTAPDPEVTERHPNVMLPDHRAYFRPETGGLLVGVREARSRTFDSASLANTLERVPLFDPEADSQTLVDGLANLRPIAPAVDRWRFRHHIAGLSTYTPDGRFVVGPFPGISGFLVAAGCCGNGVAASGGLGLLTAQLATGAAPFVDSAPYRPERFGALDLDSEEFRSRSSASRGGRFAAA